MEAQSGKNSRNLCWILTLLSTFFILEMSQVSTCWVKMDQSFIIDISDYDSIWMWLSISNKVRLLTVYRQIDLCKLWNRLKYQLKLDQNINLFHLVINNTYLYSISKEWRKKTNKKRRDIIPLARLI